MAGMNDIIMANPMGAIGQAVQTAGAMDQLSRLRAQDQTMQQDRGMALQDRQSKLAQAGVEFAAKAGMALDQVQDPMQKAAMYKQLRNMAGMQGFNVDAFPPEYTPAAQQRLDLIKAAFAQQGGEMFAPMPAFDAQGNPVFVQGSRSGGLRPIDGFRPYTPTTDEKTEAAIRQAEAKTNLQIGAAPLIAAGSERAKLDVQGRMLPQIEADKTRATETAKAEAGRATTITKAIADEKEVGRILDLAEPLLEKTTESLAGATLDAAGRLVGVSTEGSRAAAQLKTLEGALVMKMPRMEGPQSDADRLLYRQMAAQIGDPTTPVEDRRAAMSVLRDLNTRYSGQQPAPAQQQGGYQQGQIIEANGKRYRVTGGDPNDPDVEEVQ